MTVREVFMPKRKSARVRRTFTPQFKKDAIEMVRQGKTVTEVSNSLGVARSLLQYWKRQLDGEAEDPFPGRGNAKPENEDLRALKKQLKDVTEERDILKKALAYFADDQK
jgi:transposase